MLKNHFVPDDDFTFAKSFIHGCSCSGSLNYLDDLFVHSTSNNSVFCLYRALFLPQEKRKNLDAFANVGCNSCHDISERKLTAWNYHKDVIK